MSGQEECQSTPALIHQPDEVPSLDEFPEAPGRLSISLGDNGIYQVYDDLPDFSLGMNNHIANSAWNEPTPNWQALNDKLQWIAEKQNEGLKLTKGKPVASASPSCWAPDIGWA